MNEMIYSTPPSPLYRYRPANDHDRDALENNYIWMSTSEEFNDPFDSNYPCIIADMPNEQLKPLYDSWRAREPDAKKRRENDSIYLTDDVPNKVFKKYVEATLRQAWNDLTERHRIQGMACFSLRNDSVLMWSHYANKHRGFCLKFDQTIFPFTEAIKINYCHDFPVIDPIHLFLEQITPEEGRILFISKDDDWIYEQEYRLFRLITGDPENITASTRESKKFKYLTEALLAVYFGCEMPDICCKEISSFLSGTTTQVYKMKKSPTSFEVIPEPYLCP